MLHAAHSSLFGATRSRPLPLSLPPQATTPARGRKVTAASYTTSTTQSRATQSNILEAFYYGRAFAQLLSERVNSAVVELLSDFGKENAERRQAFREFQEEVLARARADMEAGPSSPSESALSSSSTTRALPPGRSQSPSVRLNAPDLQEAVDELRAEIAAARAALQALRSRSSSTGNGARAK